MNHQNRHTIQEALDQANAQADEILHGDMNFYYNGQLETQANELILADDFEGASQVCETMAKEAMVYGDRTAAVRQLDIGRHCLLQLWETEGLPTEKKADLGKRILNFNQRLEIMGEQTVEPVEAPDVSSASLEDGITDSLKKRITNQEAMEHYEERIKADWKNPYEAFRGDDRYFPNYSSVSQDSELEKRTDQMVLADIASSVEILDTTPPEAFPMPWMRNSAIKETLYAINNYIIRPDVLRQVQTDVSLRDEETVDTLSVIALHLFDMYDTEPEGMGENAIESSSRLLTRFAFRESTVMSRLVNRQALQMLLQKTDKKAQSSNEVQLTERDNNYAHIISGYGLLVIKGDKGALSDAKLVIAEHPDIDWQAILSPLTASKNREIQDDKLKDTFTGYLFALQKVVDAAAISKDLMPA